LFYQAYFVKEVAIVEVVEGQIVVVVAVEISEQIWDIILHPHAHINATTIKLA
jgi:hypothetical protein